MGGAAPTLLGPQFPHVTNTTVSSVAFLLLHGKAEREALWVGLSLGMGCPPLRCGPKAEILAFPASNNQLRRVPLLFFFLLPFGAFYNIFEQKDFFLSLLRTSALISHYNSKTGEHPLDKSFKH